MIDQFYRLTFGVNHGKAPGEGKDLLYKMVIRLATALSLRADLVRIDDELLKVTVESKNQDALIRLNNNVKFLCEAMGFSHVNGP